MALVVVLFGSLAHRHAVADGESSENCTACSLNRASGAPPEPPAVPAAPPVPRLADEPRIDAPPIRRLTVLHEAPKTSPPAVLV